MPVYRLEIEHGDTLWITAHDEHGAVELASAHVAGEALDEATSIKLTRDGDETLILCAGADEWSTAGTAQCLSKRQLAECENQGSSEALTSDTNTWRAVVGGLK